MTKLKISFLFSIIISCSVFAQISEDTALNREIILREINGVKTLTLVETKEGITTETIYKGAEADAKLAELKGVNIEENEIIEKEVLIEELNGTKKVTVTTISEEKVVQEIFTGVAADRVLRELDQEEKKGMVIKKRISKENSLKTVPATK